MIKRIRIQNYKSLGDVTVELDPVTVLIGRSGTGKSNFVDAIRFLRDYINERENAAARRGGWPRIRPLTHGSQPLELLLWFDVPEFEGLFEYQLRFSGPNLPRTKYFEERLTLETESTTVTLFHQAGDKWLRPPDGTYPQPGGLALDHISGVPEITAAYIVLSNGIGCYEFQGTVFRPSGNGVGSTGNGLNDAGGNAMGIAAGILASTSTLKRWSDLTAALRGINRSVVAARLTMPGRDELFIEHRIGEQPLTIPISDDSEGLRRYMAHLLALYQTPSKSLLVFEEPEKGIHPGALEGLVNQFRLCARSGRGQVVLTTHSPELLDHFRPEELRVVEIVNGLTQIGPLAPEQVETVRENLLRPGELLTVDPARLPGALPEVPEAVTP